MYNCKRLKIVYLIVYIIINYDKINFKLYIYKKMKNKSLNVLIK